jgi:hypothetical protein
MRKALLSLLVVLGTPVVCFSQQSETPLTSPPKAIATAPGAQGGAGSPSTGQQQSSVVLKEGTEVKLKFAQTVTSRAARPGQAIEFAVDEPVAVDGVTVINKGARSIGYVTGATSAGSVGKGGTMEIRMEAIRTRGKMVKIRGEDARGEKRATGKVVRMTLLLGLSGFLLAGGHEVKIPEGTPVTAYVAENVEFPGK